jgi:hypothetical protein
VLVFTCQLPFALRDAGGAEDFVVTQQGFASAQVLLGVVRREFQESEMGSTEKIKQAQGIVLVIQQRSVGRSVAGLQLGGVGSLALG